MDAAAWDARYRDSEYVWRIEPNQFLVDEVAGLHPGTALDLGSGEGRNAVWLAENGWTVTAIDFSPIGIDKGRKLSAARGVEVDFRVADVSAIAPPGEYDLVIVFYLHIAQSALARTLEMARGSLAQGGTLLVVGHDLSNLEDGAGGPQYPELLYTVPGILELLPGLEVVKADRVRRPVEGETREAIDTLVRVRN